MAVAAFTVVDSLLGKLPDDIRPAVGAITTLVAAVAAGTVAWMAFHGTMTLGTAIPIILTAVGVGIAGIKAMLPDSAAADVSSTSSSYAGAAANYDFTAATQAATGASPGTTTTNNTTSGDTVIEINVYNPQNADEIMEELQRRLVNSKLSYGR